MAESEPSKPTCKVYLNLKPNSLYIAFGDHIDGSEDGEQSDSYEWGLCLSEEPGCSQMMAVSTVNWENTNILFRRSREDVATDDSIIAALHIANVMPEDIKHLKRRLEQLSHINLAGHNHMSTQTWVMNTIELLDQAGFVILPIDRYESDSLDRLWCEAKNLADECMRPTRKDHMRRVERSRVVIGVMQF